MKINKKIAMSIFISTLSFSSFHAFGKSDLSNSQVSHFGLSLIEPGYTKSELRTAINNQDYTTLKQMAESSQLKNDNTTRSEVPIFRELEENPLNLLEPTVSINENNPAPFIQPFGEDEEDSDINPQEEIDQAGCSIPLGEPTTGADSLLAYFGPQPSTVNRFLIGQVPLLTAGQVNISTRQVTLPLYEGVMKNSGEKVWYIVTDTTDAGNAEGLGLNFSAKLAFSDTGRGARTANIRRNGTLEFDTGTVDFSPQRQVVPSSNGTFPPASFSPGSIGDSLYSPLVKIENAGGHIYNAPMIAFGVSAQQINAPDGNVDHSIVHDSVVAINVEEGTVTLELVLGFSFGRPIFYISTEASILLAAALEGATFAPGLTDIQTGNDDALFSAVERIFLIINGAEGCDNPTRQGLLAAINDGDTPFNILGGIPTIATDYSPLWDMNLGEWTQDAIDRGYRTRLSGEFQLLFNVENGFLTGPGGAPFSSINAIVNCPIVQRLL